MNSYDFTLKFLLPDTESDPEAYIEALASSGCDDALVGIGQNGRIVLNFTREAKSAEQAVTSALRDVKKAIPKACLTEAAPDYVGLTEIADLLGFSRQNMRKLMLNHGPNFPAPIHDGKPALWHLATVLQWLSEETDYEIDQAELSTASTTMQLNLSRELQALEPRFQETVRKLIA